MFQSLFYRELFNQLFKGGKCSLLNNLLNDGLSIGNDDVSSGKAGDSQDFRDQQMPDV